MLAFDGNDLLDWGLGVLDADPESICELDYRVLKLFKVMFDSKDESEASEARDAVRVFLTQLFKHLQEVLPQQKGLGRIKWDRTKFVFGYPTT